MPRYHYICRSCRSRAEAVKGDILTVDELCEVMFETSHSMCPSPEELADAVECPRCSSTDGERTLLGVAVSGYVRGYGYLDRDGCHRDMNLYKLQGTDGEDGTPLDPYDGMRSVGEKDEIAARLKRAGKHDPAARHYPMPGEQKSLEQAVARAAASGPVGDQ